ncbi:MAG: hypothetical protein HY556_10140 [Euryarchaeota archaeon]|nr:hypothetical protein [Euryarchaeota archaeon]
MIGKFGIGSTRAESLLPLLTVPVALVLVAGAALAAMTVSYANTSSTSHSLKAPPIIWIAGPDSSGNNFVSSWSLSSNATYFSVTLMPVPEANVTWGNLTTIKNQDTSAYTVTVTGSSVSGSSKVLDYRMEFRNYVTDALIGTLNLRDASPSASLGSMAAGAQWYVKTYVKLDTATNAADLPSSVTVSISLA